MFIMYELIKKVFIVILLVAVAILCWSIGFGAMWYFDKT